MQLCSQAVEFAAMRKAAVILLCALAACRPDRETAAPAKPKVHTVIIPEDESKRRRVDQATTGPTLIDHVFLGTQLGADGAVATNSATAAEGSRSI